MKFRIIIFDCIQQFNYLNFCVQFFFYLSYNCCFRCFIRLNLSSRKFPTTFEFPISSLSCKYFPLINDNRCHYSNCFHLISHRFYYPFTIYS